MPNGRPGDHPITDVVNHRMALFGPEADELIREIVASGGGAELERDIGVWAVSSSNADVAYLRTLRDRLRRDRDARGMQTP